MEPQAKASLDGHDLLRQARRVVEVEAAAIAALVQRLDRNFVAAVDLIVSNNGRLVLSGMGKPGFVAQKLSATFSSVGTPSLYLHPAEALHGDLGRVTADDTVLTLSNSGRTDEVVRLLPALKEIGAKLVAVTGHSGSPLAVHADVVLDIGQVLEACPLGLAPTTSTTAMMVLGDALAMCVASAKGLNAEKFARNHPGGSLGKSLLHVREVMRKDRDNPLLSMNASLSDAVAVMTQTPGRPGACVIVDEKNRLSGVFTDGDLRRLMQDCGEVLDLSQPVSELMATSPRTVSQSALVGEAIHILREHAIDQVVVVDDENRAIGLLDVQDLLAARLL